jgi:Ca2+-binding RTX toxin-like protein
MAILTVTNNADTGKGSLREAITTAQSGDTIKFAASLTNQTIALNKGIGIPKSLTLDGADAPGLTISGGKKTNIFWFGQKNNNLTVRNLTLADSYYEATAGGAIWAAENSTIKVENTKFLNNVSDGAALHGQKGSNITVINSTFDGNDGAKISDKGYSTGAISLFAYGSLTIKGSVFTNNKGYGGGALHVTSSDLIVEDSLFKGNDSTAGADKDLVAIPGGGGAIYLDAASVPNDPRFYNGPNQGETEGGVFRVSNSRFENNRGAGQGGAIMAWGYAQDRIIIRDSEIVNNEVIKNRSGMAEGGGVWLMGYGDIQNTKIANNKSADKGGGLYVWGEVPATITNSNFAGNRAVTGGAIYDGLWSSQLDIDNTKFDSNAAVDGGVLYRDKSNVPFSLQNSKLTNNKPNDIADINYSNVLTHVRFDRNWPDIRFGSYPNDTIVGTEQNSYLVGLIGNDTLKGNGGNDYLDGGDGADSLSGGAGNDTLIGGGNANNLVGGDGDDTFIGGNGQDMMWGGSGQDRYIIGDENQLFYTKYPWYDLAILRDFEPKQDTIQLKGGASDYTIKPANSQGVSGTGIFYDNGLVALVANISPNNFSLNADYISYNNSADLTG